MAARDIQVVDSGARGDGRTLDTAAIQKAIDDCSASGGGTVWFPAGRFLTGTLFLRGHVTLHLADGAVLLGSTRLEDYPAQPPSYQHPFILLGTKQTGFPSRGKSRKDLPVSGQ